MKRCPGRAIGNRQAQQTTELKLTADPRVFFARDHYFALPIAFGSPPRLRFSMYARGFC